VSMKLENVDKTFQFCPTLEIDLESYCFTARTVLAYFFLIYFFTANITEHLTKTLPIFD